MNIQKILNQKTILLGIVVLVFAFIAGSISQTRSKSSFRDFLKGYEGYNTTLEGTLQSVESDYFVIKTKGGREEVYPFHTIHSVHEDLESKRLWIDIYKR